MFHGVNFTQYNYDYVSGEMTPMSSLSVIYSAPLVQCPSRRAACDGGVDAMGDAMFFLRCHSLLLQMTMGDVTEALELLPTDTSPTPPVHTAKRRTSTESEDQACLETCKTMTFHVGSFPDGRVFDLLRWRCRQWLAT